MLGVSLCPELRPTIVAPSAAAPAYRPRPRTPPNCKDPELQALAPPLSPAAPPFPTSSTPSLVAFFNIRARVQNRACKAGRGRMGDLR